MNYLVLAETHKVFSTPYKFLVLELHKQEPWYSNKTVGFKPLPLIGVNAWSKYNVDPGQTSRFCGISILCFCWSRVFGCSLLFSIQSMAWQATFDVITSWPFMRPPWKTGGKSLYAFPSGAEIHFNIILSTFIWWNKKAFLYKVILALRWCIEIISSFQYLFFTIEWTAIFTENIGLLGIWCFENLDQLPAI